MSGKIEYIVGTSGYSFADWVGPFYPAGTRQQEMFGVYADHFGAVELNFTFYRLEAGGTLAKLAERSPRGFQFWVKANRKITHDGELPAVKVFLENLEPMKASGKLSGVLLQFPQSFHRTVGNRKYLGEALEELAGADLAVEFRHSSWDHSSTVEGLREREVTLVIPDCPEVKGLYRPEVTVTTSTGYLRLHSRDAGKWYAGAVARYDYNYSEGEMEELAKKWSGPEMGAQKVFAFFNNCHGGQAAKNAEAFGRIVEQLGGE